MDEIKRIPVKLVLSDYIITFEYCTWKSQKRKEGKMKIKHYSGLEARDYFRKWVKKIRTMSNAKILDTVEIKETRQEVVL
ncbi:hypothetical protein [Clostridium beijerinckii]|uniref:hypothetical protein n=1 Tax=Clostridium beijerinckii TaxID=1520 RepID=UPI00136109FE|nr:hypothetical protein [Clostridium beijerinckii]MZK53482.1 hypothetical protein [Clostridium beijerinckii]MZK61620.1 hypothetical protein [Clostridium beijerinckii]MZK71845.1 hypothetical protein [Clostridium beijerinckii]MZK77249.1 hypothetical protein [Clostridium beijerinckii]MZK86328.1 hypothetical protein [Clostridium beijerinckii]